MGKLIFSEGAPAGKSLVTFRVGKHEATIEIVAPDD
jgi:hypothetical protein